MLFPDWSNNWIVMINLSVGPLSHKCLPRDAHGHINNFRQFATPELHLLNH